MSKLETILDGELFMFVLLYFKYQIMKLATETSDTESSGLYRRLIFTFGLGRSFERPKAMIFLGEGVRMYAPRKCFEMDVRRLDAY